CRFAEVSHVQNYYAVTPWYAAEAIYYCHSNRYLVMGLLHNADAPVSIGIEANTADNRPAALRSAGLRGRHPAMLARAWRSGQRIGPEQQQHLLARLTEVAAVQGLDLAAAVDLAQLAVDQQAQILVATRQGQGRRLQLEDPLQHLRTPLG